MRPGLVFIALFVLLIAVRQLTVDALGGVLTFILQAAIVLAILAGALWLRRKRSAGAGDSDRS